MPLAYTSDLLTSVVSATCVHPRQYAAPPWFSPMQRQMQSSCSAFWHLVSHRWRDPDEP